MTQTSGLEERPTYLFGAGAAASWILQGFRRDGIRVDGFLDDAADRIGTVGAVPVFLPDDDRALGQDLRGTSTVVMAVMSPRFDEVGARERLMSLGWADVRGFGEYGRAMLAESGRRCAMLSADELDSHVLELAQVRSLLGDDQSRQVFDGFLSFVRDLDDTGLPPITEHPYYPDDLPRWPEPLRMIDLGAFDGETVAAAIDRGYDLEAAVSFEPDPTNFAQLAQTSRDIPGMSALPLGVLDRTCVLKFASQGDAGSFVSESGDIAIQCVALDDAIPHFAPNMIKLDIEGSEEAALRGSEALLRKYRPCLAVSLYHLSTDVWRIPLYLRDVLGDCDFRLRRHSRTIADTVLYVYPLD